jgi:hypothetical protein
MTKLFRKIDIEAALLPAEIKEHVVNGVKVADIKLTDTMHKACAFYGVNIRDLNNTAAQVGEPRSEIFPGNYEREAAGLEGGLAASAYLCGNSWTALRSWSMGKPDEGDIAVVVAHKAYYIDCKMRTKPTHKLLRLTLHQWRNHAWNSYVACQYPTDARETVTLWGYIERQQIDKVVVSEISRMLGKPFTFEYTGEGANRKVAMSWNVLKAIIEALWNSGRLQHVREEENVKAAGMYDFGFDPEFAVPLNQLTPIQQLRDKIQGDFHAKEASR